MWISLLVCKSNSNALCSLTFVYPSELANVNLKAGWSRLWNTREVGELLSQGCRYPMRGCIRHLRSKLLRICSVISLGTMQMVHPHRASLPVSRPLQPRPPFNG